MDKYQGIIIIIIIINYTGEILALLLFKGYLLDSAMTSNFDHIIYLQQTNLWTDYSYISDKNVRTERYLSLLFEKSHFLGKRNINSAYFSVERGFSTTGNVIESEGKSLSLESKRSSSSSKEFSEC